MRILAIDTSCDETAAAVIEGRRILSNEVYSQILIHKKWGGVVPNLAKRAHEEKINLVINEALRRSRLKLGVGNWKLENDVGSKNKKISHLTSKIQPLTSHFSRHIDYIAVTYGPGLAPALEVGIRKAKELAKKYNKKIIAVNHMEGHIYSCFAQNGKGNPVREFDFPYLVLLVSGGHTELIIFNNHLDYKIIGETVDDAAGEALDKAAKMMGLGYPGGPIIERLAKIGNKNYHKFPRPLIRSENLNFSFSGLKTSLYYFFKNLKEEDRLNNLNNISASYQEAIIDSLLIKLEKAMKSYGIKNILVAGGVAANQYFRVRVRSLIKTSGGNILFPAFKKLCTDNAAMIGIAAYYKRKAGIFVKDLSELERVPRAKLE